MLEFYKGATALHPKRFLVWSLASRIIVFINFFLTQTADALKMPNRLWAKNSFLTCNLFNLKYRGGKTKKKNNCYYY